MKKTIFLKYLWNHIMKSLMTLVIVATGSYKVQQNNACWNLHQLKCQVHSIPIGQNLFKILSTVDEQFCYMLPVWNSSKKINKKCKNL